VTARVAAVAAAVVLAVALAACGGGGDSGGGAASPAPGTPAAQGEQLVERLGCLSGHTSKGARGAGPRWKGVAGRQVKLSDGTTVTADDEYLRRSILDPSAQVVAGFPGGLMAATVKPGSVTPEQADQIVAFLRTVR
jgi:cytochrome c2